MPIDELTKAIAELNSGVEEVEAEQAQGLLAKAMAGLGKLRKGAVPARSAVPVHAERIGPVGQGNPNDKESDVKELGSARKVEDGEDCTDDDEQEFDEYEHTAERTARARKRAKGGAGALPPATETAKTAKSMAKPPADEEEDEEEEPEEEPEDDAETEGDGEAEGEDPRADTDSSGEEAGDDTDEEAQDRLAAASAAARVTRKKSASPANTFRRALESFPDYEQYLDGSDIIRHMADSMEKSLRQLERSTAAALTAVQAEVAEGRRLQGEALTASLQPLLAATQAMVKSQAVLAKSFQEQPQPVQPGVVGLLRPAGTAPAAAAEPSGLSRTRLNVQMTKALQQDGRVADWLQKADSRSPDEVLAMLPEDLRQLVLNA